MSPPSTGPAGGSGAARTALLFLVPATLLFSYVAARAALLPITWDEAYSYLEFTRQGILLPVRFPAMAANNHYLNTWLTYLTTGALGVSELTLRLPTLMAYSLFLYYTARLSNELSVPVLRVAAFVVLNANPYLLDFFSLSRGYGLGYALLAGSLWHLRRFLQTDLEVRHSRISLGLAVLAVTAHLTLIPFLVSLAAVIVLATALCAPVGNDLPSRFRYGLRLHAPALAGIALLCVPLLFLVGRLRHARALFYGGTMGFWQDTIVGMFDRSLYEQPYAAPGRPLSGGPPFGLSSLLGVLAVLLTVVALAVSLRRIARRRHPRDLYLPALVFLLCSCALATIVQHHALGVPYLTGRTAVYLLLLGSFVVVTLADAMAGLGGLSTYCLPALAVVMAVHLLACLNVSYALEWKVEADVKRMIADVAAARDPAPPGGNTTVLGMNLEFEAPINFYRLVDGLSWLNVADRRMKFHPLSDFYLWTESDWRTVNAEDFVVLKTYPLTGSRLVRGKSRPSQYEVRFDRTLDFEAPADSVTTLRATSREAAYRGLRGGFTDARHRRSGGIHYSPNIGRGDADSSLVVVSAMMWMESLRNATARLVVEFAENGRELAWQGMTVQDQARRARTWFPVHLTAFVPAAMRAGDQISVYLTNRSDPVYIDDLRMRWVTAQGARDSVPPPGGRRRPAGRRAPEAARAPPAASAN